jgi:hypothetical protein
MAFDTLRARVSGRLAVAVAHFAKDCGTTRSQVIRHLVTTGLESRGYWPPGPPVPGSAKPTGPVGSGPS